MSTEKATEIAVQEETAVVIFEAMILDIKEPVKLTADLIRKESKVLTDLVIKDIFDTAGYDAVKKAKNLAVKTRTSIEKLEKAKNADLKADFEKKKKEVTDYTAGLYAACREVEDSLQKKLTDIDQAKATAALALAEQREARTTARENKMYELGLAWNGKEFMGYGKFIGKGFLFDLDDAGYDSIVTELAGLQIQAGLNPAIAPPAPIAPIEMGTMRQGPSNDDPIPIPTFKPFENTIYEKYIYEHGVHIFITNGQVPEHPAATVINDEIKESGYFVQVLTR